MKKILATTVLFILTISAFSQDFDVYLKNKNDNYSFPTIPQNMDFHEFYLLSQTFRMQDMLYSIFVPGYVHFEAQENKTAYSLIAVRSSAIITLGYEYLHFNNLTKDSTKFFSSLFSNSDSAFTKIDKFTIEASLITIATTYLFDIIHGKYIMQKKQEKIRFKYSLKTSAMGLNPYQKNKLGINIGICMYF